MADEKKKRKRKTLADFLPEAPAHNVDEEYVKNAAIVKRAALGGRIHGWAYEHKVTLDFSRPGNPTDNACAKSFNGRLREKCFNANWFLSLEDAQSKIEACNMSRPHTALGHVPPTEFTKTRKLHSLTGPKTGGPSTAPTE